MTTLEERVRSALSEFVGTNKEQNTEEDILRVFRNQAELLFQTTQLRTALCSDPYQHLGSLHSILPAWSESINVTDYHKVISLDGHVHIHAQVSIHNVPDNVVVLLTFSYERRPDAVVFSIDASKNYQLSNRMLWVQIWPVGDTPSSLPAQKVQFDEEDGWSDMEDKDDDDDRDGDDDDCNDNDPDEKKMSECNIGNKNVCHDRCCKRPRRDNGTTIHHESSANETNKMDEEPSMGDRFTAGIDPDILAQFLAWSNLPSSVDDLTALFLFMTFGFYEHEWDLIGLVLDAVFETGDDDDDDGSNDSHFEEEIDGDHGDCQHP